MNRFNIGSASLIHLEKVVTSDQVINNLLHDSGATFRMTGDLKKLSKAYGIRPILVNMPNGQNNVASKQGMVRLKCSNNSL